MAENRLVEAAGDLLKRAEELRQEGNRLMDLVSVMESTEPVSVRDYAAREYLKTYHLGKVCDRVNEAGHRIPGCRQGTTKMYGTNDVRDLILESSEPADPAILDQAVRTYNRNYKIMKRFH